MKRWILLFVLFVLTINSINAQDQISGREFSMQYEDTVYIMKKYFLCILVSGPSQDQSPGELMDLQVAHLEYIQQMASAGKVAISGPVQGGSDSRKRGILVFDTETQEEAEALACQDPMVRVSRLDFEMLPWWAAKGSVLP
jgi:uncharacterized protein